MSGAKKIVVLTGAGMSQESGLKTFRDMGGIWEQYDVTRVASPEAWKNDPELVLRFYNERRKQLFNAQPNAGHYGLAELEKYFDVEVITQNVDDLHEQAGSSNVLHLHGELKKARSTARADLIYALNHWELKLGDLCELGSQLRPHVVWFGETVPAMGPAIEKVQQADLFIVVGTSLAVYPAASLLAYAGSDVPVYVIDPGNPNISGTNAVHIKEKAAEGVHLLKTKLIKTYA